jgi:uncharacterized protein YlxP (DUF503 family)
MIIGVLQAEIFIQGSTSLKEKRMIVKSLKDRIVNKFNVSVAEIDYQDKWQRALLAFAAVSNKKSHTEEVLQKIFQYLTNDYRFELTNHKFEYR